MEIIAQVLGAALEIAGTAVAVGICALMLVWIYGAIREAFRY